MLQEDEFQLFHPLYSWESKSNVLSNNLEDCVKPRPEVLIAKGFIRLINAMQVCADLKRPLKDLDTIATTLLSEIESYEVNANRYDTAEVPGNLDYRIQRLLSKEF